MGIKVESIEPDVWDAVRAIVRDEIKKSPAEAADKSDKTLAAVISTPAKKAPEKKASKAKKAEKAKKAKKAAKAAAGVILAMLVLTGCSGSPVQAQAEQPMGLIQGRNLDLTDTTSYTWDVGPAYAGLSTNTSSAMVVTFDVAPSSLNAGLVVSFLAHTDCGAAATLNVNSLGAKAIFNSNDVSAVAAGDIIEGQIVTVIYDGTQFQNIGQTASQD